MQKIDYFDMLDARRQRVMQVMAEGGLRARQLESLGAPSPDAEVLLVGLEALAPRLAELGQLVRERPQRDVILLLAERDDGALVAAMRAGVRDVVTGPELLLDAL